MPAAALGIVHRVRNSGYDRSMIRIGLLGASRIARAAIIAPARDIAGVTVTRVAARSIGRAREYADKHGIADIESDYAALVASDDVDLVYNALPPSEHASWTIAALGAGKHVLCEKPFAMNAGFIDVSGLQKPVFEAVDSEPFAEPALKVGSMTEANTNGNWKE